MTPLTEAAINGVKSVGTVLGPTDEWEPMLMVQTEDGAAAIPVAPFFTSDERRMMLADRVLPQMIVDVQIEEIVIISPAWVGDEVEIDDDVERPTEDNHKYEAVLVTSITKERIENHMARVTRSEDAPPTLGDFERPFAYLFGATGQIAIQAFEALKARG